MSNNTISTYKFKPFQFTVLKKNLDPQQHPLARSGHRVVCNNAYLFSYGGFNPQTNVNTFFSYIQIIANSQYLYLFECSAFKMEIILLLIIFWLPMFKS